jgi:hypothetical protein
MARAGHGLSEVSLGLTSHHALHLCALPVATPEMALRAFQWWLPVRQPTCGHFLPLWTAQAVRPFLHLRHLRNFRIFRISEFLLY